MRRGKTRTLGRMGEVIATREFKPSLQRVLQAMGQDSRSQGSAWFRRWAVVLNLACIAWIVWAFITKGEVMLQGVLVGLGGAALMWLVFVWAMPRFVASRPHVSTGLTLRRYSFDAEALFLETTEGVALKAPYRTFSKISMGADYILFYESFPGLAAHVIPSDVFESKDQESLVRSWLGGYAS